MGEPSVSEWRDSSGNGNHAVQSVAGTRPTDAGPQALYATGGTLAIRTIPPPFEAPEGFVRRAEFHMTLLDIADSKILRAASGRSGRVYEAWLDEVVEAKGGPDGAPMLVGVGYAEHGPNAAFFEVWEWPEAQAWRAAMTLPPKDLHVTICVRGADVHGVPKGRETLIG